MWSTDKLPGRLVILGMPLLVIGSVLLLHILPNEVLALLTAWTLLSFPVGVLIGHCVLSEE
jgi:hypothetical protein